MGGFGVKHFPIGRGPGPYLEQNFNYTPSSKIMIRKCTVFNFKYEQKIEQADMLAQNLSAYYS